MSPESTKLIGAFGAAVSNECITGEQDYVSRPTMDKLLGHTQSARAALVAQIEKLERSYNTLTKFVAVLDEMGFDTDEPINGGDCVEAICEQYPALKAAS